MNNSNNNLTRVVLPYAVFGAIYITLSDYVARKFTTGVDDLFLISMTKGLIFILITAVLVYYLVKNYTLELNKVNKNFLQIFRSLPEAVIIFDKSSGKITSTNRAARELTGYEQNELKGISPLTLFMSQNSNSEVETLLENPESKSDVFCKLVTKSGNVLPANISNALIKTPLSETRCILIIRDLSVIDTQRKEIEKQKNRLEEIMAGVDTVIWSYIHDSPKFLYINNAAEKVFEIPFQKIAADPNKLFPCVLPEDRDKLLTAYENLNSGKTKYCRVEYRIITPTNKLKWLETRFWGDTNHESEKLRIRGITADITEIKKYELNKIEHTKKIEGLAFLTAHEVRKPVCNILGLINLIKEEEQGVYQKSEYIKLFEESARELDGVVKNLTKQIEDAQTSDL